MLSAAAVCAGVAGGTCVAAAWETLAAVEQAAPARTLARWSRPLVSALRAGHEPTPPERRRLALVFALTLLGAGWLLVGPVGGVMAAAAGPWGVGRVLAARRRRWRAGVADGAPAAARALADALSGGHSIRGALAEVARSGGAGAAADAELRACAAALALGAPTPAALEALRQRAGAPAWDTIVAAIGLQHEAGGDLAGLLRDLAADLEAARRATADARAATAQARFSAGVVAALPVGAALLAELASPGALGRMAAHPVAGWLVGAAVVLQAVALVVVRRLTRLGDPA
ncbi:MAG: tight adherence protein [Solirubrobacteraceae bacterium]|nr:tight adherence protein [Solirubrobacteraceae bacterium]